MILLPTISPKLIWESRKGRIKEAGLMPDKCSPKLHLIYSKYYLINKNKEYRSKPTSEHYHADKLLITTSIRMFTH